MSRCNQSNSDIFKASIKQLSLECELAALSKALAHPTRIRILSVLHKLYENDDCLNSDLVSQLGLAQSTVSEHLRILKNTGLVNATSVPPKVCYRINKSKLEAYQSFFLSVFP